MREKLISIQNLNVNYEDIRVLTNVNLDIYSDDFIGIIGPNGGGKTSLIKAILHLIPYSGNISYFNGLQSKNIGYMPQTQSFDRSFPITVKEVVNSGLSLSAHSLISYKNKNNSNYICDKMREFSILHLSRRAISELSGGELQRTLLCRAVINKPRLLILDEPTNFVDNEFEAELYHLLKKLNDEMAIIMVSHDLGTISSAVKSIVCVNKTVHRHDTNILIPEMFENYRCPIQIISHGEIPHTVLAYHKRTL